MRSLLNIALAFVVAGLLSSCTRIESGYEGILIKLYGSDKGAKDAISLVDGRVTYNPFYEDVVKFPLFVQTVDYAPFTVNAKDGSVFTLDPTISIRVLPGHTPAIYAKYRKSLEEIVKTTMFNHVRDAFRIQFNKFTTDDVISNREEFENKVQQQITEILEKEGFFLEQLTSGMTYPQTIVNAIDEKNKAVQKAMEAENKLRIAEAEAKIEIVKAQAEAEANRIRQQALTPLIIQQQFIEKWDGRTPLYGSNPVLFKNVN